MLCSGLSLPVLGWDGSSSPPGESLMQSSAVFFLISEDSCFNLCAPSSSLTHTTYGRLKINPSHYSFFLKITVMLTNNLCLALYDGGLVGSCIVLTVQLPAPLGGACPGCTPVPLWRNAALASSGLFGLDATDNCHESICLPGRARSKYFYVMVCNCRFAQVACSLKGRCPPASYSLKCSAVKILKKTYFYFNK